MTDEEQEIKRRIKRIKKRKSYKDWEDLYEVLEKDKPIEDKLKDLWDYMYYKGAFRYNWLAHSSFESLITLLKEKKNDENFKFKKEEHSKEFKKMLKRWNEEFDRKYRRG